MIHLRLGCVPSGLDESWLSRVRTATTADVQGGRSYNNAMKCAPLPGKSRRMAYVAAAAGLLLAASCKPATEVSRDASFKSAVAGIGKTPARRIRPYSNSLQSEGSGSRQDASQKTSGPAQVSAPDGVKQRGSEQSALKGPISQDDADVFVDINHAYNDPGQDCPPNPNPRPDFLDFKMRLQARGLAFVVLRPVEDVVSHMADYENAQVILSLPTNAVQEVRPLGPWEGLSFLWSDARFGTYLFNCPIPSVAEDYFSRGWRWDLVRDTGNYLHIIGRVAGLTQSTNRLGMTIQIPIVLVEAADDGWRFASVSRVTADAVLERARQQEEAGRAARQEERDLEASVMILSRLIAKVDVVYYEEGPGFVLHISSNDWFAMQNRGALLASLGRKIQSICRERRMREPYRVAAWDTSVGSLGEWSPTAGVYALR